MTQDDVLFGYRLQLFALAGQTTVTHACRTFGVHRSTYYAWRAQVDRQGLEMLRPRERRRPVMPNQLSPVIEQRIVAFSLGHPGLGPKRISAQLARPQWGGLLVSPNGVYKALRRHGLNTRAKRLALVAGYRAPYEPPREVAPEPHVDTHHPASWSASTAFTSGAYTAPRGRSGRSPRSIPTAPSLGPISSSHRSRARRSSRPRRWRSAWQPSCRPRVGGSSACSATTAANSAAANSPGGCPTASSTPRSAPADRNPTATSSGCTERSSRSAGAPPSLASCKSASQACDASSRATSPTTTTSAPTRDASRPGDARPTSSTVPARWSPDEPPLSAHPEVRSD